MYILCSAAKTLPSLPIGFHLVTSMSGAGFACDSSDFHKITKNRLDYIQVEYVCKVAPLSSKVCLHTNPYKI